ncbi:TPA: hypothetical protein I8V59_000655 [Corynebacterium striatum]|nr:hypothetical protein [Corynebacterium striatum]
MPTISGSLVYVTQRAAAVSEVLVRARDVRTSAQGVVVESNDRIPVVGGAVSFEVLPGPAVMTLVEAGRPVETIPILVGDAPEQSLMDVVDAALIVDESTQSVLESLAAQVVADAHAAAASAAAAKESQVAAASSASAAEGSASAADVSAKAAKASQDAAAGSASSAKQSESNAAASKNAAASSASDAATSAGNAKKSEDAAKAAQARSEEIATSTSWSGDKLTVNGKTSPSLRGPKGDKGDTGSVENVSWADISDKPAVFPPNTHTHTMVQVTGLDNALAGKTDKAYVDAQDAKRLTASEVEAKGASPAAGKVVRRDSAGQVLVPTAVGGNNTAVSRSELTSGMAGKADKSYVDAVKAEVKVFAESRPAFFSGSGGPPSTIPGAVVGDYYLNETTMELHKITGV